MSGRRTRKVQNELRKKRGSRRRRLENSLIPVEENVCKLLKMFRRQSAGRTAVIDFHGFEDGFRENRFSIIIPFFAAEKLWWAIFFMVGSCSTRVLINRLKKHISDYRNFIKYQSNNFILIINKYSIQSIIKSKSNITQIYMNSLNCSSSFSHPKLTINSQLSN